MPAPTFVNTAIVTGTAADCSDTNPITISVPSGVQDGDIIIVTVLSYTSSGESYAWAVSPVVPASWTEIGARVVAGTLVYQSWAAPYNVSMDLDFIGNLSVGRRVLPTALAVRGAADIGNWVIGTESSRIDNGTSTTTVATSIDTVVDDTLVVGFFAERTTAAETDTSGVSGAAKYAYLYDATYSSIETLAITEEALVGAGACGDTTVTYVNTQTNNGVGQHVGIPPASAYPNYPQKIGYFYTEVDKTPGALQSSITLDPSLPTNGSVPAIGDWMIAAIGVNANNGCGTFTVPDGWISVNDSYTLVGTYNTKLLVRRRQAGDTSYTFTNSGDRDLNGALFWIRGAARYSQWAIGTPKTRSDAPAETSTITTQSVTVPPASLVLSFGFEQTATSELATDVTVSGATKWFTAPQTGNGSVTISVASEQVASGNSSQAVFTYPNADATNGWGYQIAIPAEVLNDGYPVFLQASDGIREARAFYISVGGPAIPSKIAHVGTGYATVSDMLAATPFYVAHRGGSRSYPEMSLHAYTQSIINGYKALELSLARTSDGVWFGLHDTTLDRTSGVTGVTASAITWAQVQTYNILGSMAADNPTQPNRPYMRWEEIIAAYYPSHIIFVDPKVALSYRSELLAMMDALPGTPQDHFVAKYYGVEGGVGNTGWAKDAADHGYERWGYFYQADASNFATYQGRWTILGMDYTADQATWNAILSYGKPVIGHICPDAAAVTTALTKGADGLMVSGSAAVAP